MDGSSENLVWRTWAIYGGVALLLAAAAGFAAAQWLDQNAFVLWAAAGVGTAGALATVGAAGSILRGTTRPTSGSSAYARHVFAVGAVMIAGAGAGIFGVAGLTANGKLRPTGVQAAAAPGIQTETALTSATTSQNGDVPPRQGAMYIALAGAMAFLGALFFVTNSMWRARYGDPVEREGQRFDDGQFWAGLSFRIGEALIFVLVFIMFGVRNEGVHVQYLPIIGLLFGMFVKSGEQVVFGLARRVFDAVAAALPSHLGREPPSPRHDGGGMLGPPPPPPPPTGGEGSQTVPAVEAAAAPARDAPQE